MAERDLVRQLAIATAAARDAYRETSRMIRLLSVVGQPAEPGQLLDQTLHTLSEVFLADVVAVTRWVGSQSVVTSSCGLSDNDPVWQEGWALTSAAGQALRTGEVVARTDRLDPDLPPSLATLGVRSAAWVPLTNRPGGEDLLILLRRSRAPFSYSDQHVLKSVAARLRLAVEERERSAVVERLARDGHLLGRHLELEPLLDEAVGLLRQLTDADQTWVVTLDGDLAQLRAHRGLSPAALASWPRPAVTVAQWCPSSPAVPPQLNRTTPPAAPDSITLRVPVRNDGGLAAVLYAARDRRRPFKADAPEVAAILANYLAVAMVNAELYRTLQQRATHDPLTGLTNRTLVNQHLDQVLSSDPPMRVGLLFCDLDRFKAVNDLLGHETGDDLLQQVAERLRGSVRPSDLLARFGGDEFVIVLDRVRNLAEVAEVGRRVASALDREFMLRSERVKVTASIGGVLGVSGETTASVMLRNADAAMYVAKDRGLGQVEVFDEAASHRALDRLDLRAELPHALDRGELALHYQPIMALESGRVVAMEARLRWHHPRHGTVPPEVFVPLAEDTGAMVAIGRWVLARACRQLASWQRLPGLEELAISVNLSADQLRGTGAADQLLAVVRGTGVSPADLWLEVTEQRFRSDEVIQQATLLQAAGVHFALDQFGTAHSSLRFLHRFPIEILKIDLRAADEVTQWDRDPSMVRAILAIARSLQLTAVGEGIATQPQRIALCELACPLGQGQLLSPPLPAAEATALLRAPVTLPA